MLNIHTELFDKVQNNIISPDDFFILLCITKRIDNSRSSFPSVETLMKESTFGRDKVYKCINNLVKTGFLTKEQRRVKNKSGKEVLSSNLYTIKTNLLGVYISSHNQTLSDNPVTTDLQATDLQATENKTGSIVHSSLSINQSIEVRAHEKNSIINTIKSHPLYPRAKQLKFSLLSEEEIDLCIELAVENEKSKGRSSLNIQTAINYLSNENNQKKTTASKQYKQKQVFKPYYREYATREEYEQAIQDARHNGMIVEIERLPDNAASFWGEQTNKYNIKTIDQEIFIDENARKNELYNQII